ncbi:MAG: polyketide cyclase [Ilumatobacteraceae bacterium]|nr:polyketide cyclase [Ilumatobacteraceae bacterium]
MSVLVPQDLVFADRAPWRFDFEGLVHATPAEVWSTFIDNESWTQWFTRCKACTATSDPFDGEGSTRRIDVNGLRVEERFIAWQPERLWAFTAEKMRMSFAVSMVERALFDEPTPGWTHISYRMAVQPHWWALPLRRLIASQGAATFQRSFIALDHYIAEHRTRHSAA